MAQQIKALTSVREIHRAKFQELYEYAVASPTDAACHAGFKIRFRNLETLYENFEQVHLDIVKFVSAQKEPDLAAEEAIRREVSAKYFEIIAIFEALFPVVLDQVTRDSDSPVSTMHGGSRSKLQKIPLPKFDGSLKSWLNYRDLFQNIVHADSSLKDIEKFQYLQMSLSGEPLALVKTLPMSSENYPIAYRTLLEHYNNERALSTLYWSEIQNLPSLVEESPQALRNLLHILTENLEALKTLGLPVDQWDFVLFNIVIQKLDKETRKQFEIKLCNKNIPQFTKLKAFLTDHCVALESLAMQTQSSKLSDKSNIVPPSNRQNFRFSPRPRRSMVSHITSPCVNNSIQSKGSSAAPCPVCTMNHLVYRCPSFMALTPLERYSKVKQTSLCINCLQSGHSVAKCSSLHSCRNCGAKHHSLLHFPRGSQSAPPERGTPSNHTQVSQNEASSSLNSPNPNPVVRANISNVLPAPVLLATVWLEIQDRFGQWQGIRALLDPGSQASFITSSSAQRLQLSRQRRNIPIFGLGNTPASSSSGVATCNIRSCSRKDSRLTLEVIILQTICSSLPSTPIDPNQWNHIQDLIWADPNWTSPGPIDMLLGADIYPSIVREGVIRGEPHEPIAIQTIFGWTLLGNTSTVPGSTIRSHFIATEPYSDDLIRRFWEIENVPPLEISSPEDKIVERHFQETHFRTPLGRFGVTLPFKVPSPVFPNSSDIARRRFLSLERKLQNDTHLREMYCNFMQDYLSSGHMSLVSPPPKGDDLYYVPHHGVVTTQGSREKIRVVFDASAKASNGLSLNDTLHTGPKLQNNIVGLLLQFRLGKFVLTCDIRQMYRQILVAPECRKFQLIHYRFSPNDPIETYQLNTVTYGMSSSPFLAIRVLLALAHEHALQFPLASKAIQENLYVDDVICSFDTLDSALRSQEELIALMNLGCFELRKWSSNHPVLLENIPIDHRQQEDLRFEGDSDATIKVLGLQWLSSVDAFSFQVTPRESPCTKRGILSEIARVYDPLGFLCPLTLFVKVLLQRLWSLGIDWDQPPPADISGVWNQFKSESPHLSSLRIPRPLQVSSGHTCQIHAFCDASERGYAGVIYLRFQQDDQVTIRLLIAKSKVAPLKTLSIPRLELCACVLLSNLISFVLDSYQSQLSVESIWAWTDSQVALSWIRSPPHRWKVFVSNRVAHIQDHITSSSWHHVRSADNPADPASRGLLPEALSSCSLWWAGPKWLNEPPSSWPSSSRDSIDTSIPEMESERKNLVLVAKINSSWIDSLLDRRSLLHQSQVIVAMCQRFVHNSRCPNDRKVGPITPQELYQALLHMVNVIQQQAFSEEIAKVQHGQCCSRPFQKLSPFLDSNGTLRVGGRLAHSRVPFATKHPAILPGRHRLTELLVDQVHQRYLHPGINTTLYLIQQNFWIVSGRKSVRHYLSKCNRCFRTNPTSFTPPMANLPAMRVSQVKPFSVVGVDYAGPFAVTLGKHRGAKSTKAYLCLFVCFATKCLHLELTSDLSADAFLAALRRFIARRGRCQRIYSDCGTNFIGAHRQLNQLFKSCVERENIHWTFNPPSAPHFGGLWENSVKSVKTHLKRVIGDQVLTYEELNTVLVQIESVLNSRPLCSLSSDPNDLSSLTPGHFLTLEPLSAPPDADLSHLKLWRLGRWQLVQHLHQSFWARWKKEYLHNLYQLSKWAKSGSAQAADVGTLVLIKDDLVSPLHWRLGRIIELHPGADGVARVASVRTVQGICKRPLVKLCALPSQ